MSAWVHWPSAGLTGSADSHFVGLLKLNRCQLLFEVQVQEDELPAEASGSSDGAGRSAGTAAESYEHDSIARLQMPPGLFSADYAPLCMPDASEVRPCCLLG